MCCCDCLLVEALTEAAMVDDVRRLKQQLQAQPGSFEPPEFVSIDRVPQHLCGWSMLSLLHRRRHARDIRTLLS